MPQTTENGLAKRVQGLDDLIRLQFDQPSEKRKLSYGHSLAKRMWSYITDSNVGYYGQRYRQWKENENWMKGVIDDTEFKSYMGVEGNKTWLNMDYTVIKVIPRYIQAIINRFMEREEKPKVKATDILSSQYKTREKIKARVRMNNNQRIKQMEAVSGMKLQDGFTPEDEDELDIYYKIKWRMPEEAFMEDTAWQVFQNSDYEYIKRECIRDCIKTNLMVTKLKELPYTPGRTPADRIRIRRCDPKNTVYNIFKQENGADITIIGEAFAYKISEARREYPNISEDIWFKLAQSLQKGLTQSEPLNWSDTWVYSFNRPYDDYAFIAFDFEVRVFDPEYYVNQQSEDGYYMMVQKKGRPVNLGPDKSVQESGRYNRYAGMYAITSDVMMDWKVEANQIRPYQNGVDCFSAYSVQYPAADGFYVPALVERGIPPVRQMMLIGLKIQQMVALMEPDATDIDISGLKQLDIGTGKKLKPIQLTKLKAQTGKGYWDSTDDTGVDSGVERKSPWQAGHVVGNAAQINVLIPLYNFWLQRVNDEWGENQETLGQPTAAKKSAAATKQAAAMGGGATEYVYDAWVALCEQNATKIIYRLWDMLVLEANDYKSNAGIDRNLVDTTFDANISVVDKKAAKERLMARIQEALDSKIITASMAERLEDIDNPKDAILYLEQVEKQSRKLAQAAQDRQIKMNAQVQQQSTQIATQGKIQTEMAKAQAKMVVEHLKADDEGFRDLLKMITDTETEMVKTGGQLPPDIAALKELMVQTVMAKKAMNEQKMQGQQQQSQGQPQDQGQPQAQ